VTGVTITCGAVGMGAASNAGGGGSGSGLDDMLVKQKFPVVMVMQEREGKTNLKSRTGPGIDNNEADLL
jgi:hypothetical protein